jgi:23S rRNA pseudouridine2604 synthase
MNVGLSNIALGKWRNLTKEELAEIMRLIENSSKTEEASIVAPSNTFHK